MAGVVAPLGAFCFWSSRKVGSRPSSYGYDVIQPISSSQQLDLS
jgi:hypothetical protein